VDKEMLESLPRRWELLHDKLKSEMRLFVNPVRSPDQGNPDEEVSRQFLRPGTGLVENIPEYHLTEDDYEHHKIQYGQCTRFKVAYYSVDDV
jgi:hypothetical protein